VHLIIGILIGIVFFALLAKALLETAWGICLIIAGVFCQILAKVLRLTAKAMRFYGRISKRQKTKNIPEHVTRPEVSISRSLALYHQKANSTTHEDDT
jgi:hypothetical protein